MSHNVSMSGIAVEDLNILERAIKELNKEHGTDFTLERGEVVSRNYSTDYMRNNANRVIPNTIAVIKTGSEFQFDITITRDPKTKKVDMQTESLMIRPLMNKFGVPASAYDFSKKETVSTGHCAYRNDEELGIKSALGTITQRYAVLVAERQAAMAGQTCRRTKDAKTGVIALTVSVK